MECDCCWQLFSIFYRAGRNCNKSTSLCVNIIIEFQQQYFPQRSFRKTAKGIGEIFAKINNFRHTCIPTYVRGNLKMRYLHFSHPRLDLHCPRKIFPLPRKRDIFHAFFVQLNIHRREKEREREFPRGKFCKIWPDRFEKSTNSSPVCRWNTAIWAKRISRGEFSYLWNFVFLKRSLEAPLYNVAKSRRRSKSVCKYAVLA